MSTALDPPPPATSTAALVDAVLRADGGCAGRCDAPAIVRALSEMGATDVEGLELLVRQCRAELTDVALLLAQQAAATAATHKPASPMKAVAVGEASASLFG